MKYSVSLESESRLTEGRMGPVDCGLRIADCGLGRRSSEFERDGPSSLRSVAARPMSQSWRARHSGDSFGSSQGLVMRASANLDSKRGRFGGAANSSMAKTASTNDAGSFSGDLRRLAQAWL